MLAILDDLRQQWGLFLLAFWLIALPIGVAGYYLRLSLKLRRLLEGDLREFFRFCEKRAIAREFSEDFASYLTVRKLLLKSPGDPRLPELVRQLGSRSFLQRSLLSFPTYEWIELLPPKRWREGVVH